MNRDTSPFLDLRRVADSPRPRDRSSVRLRSLGRSHAQERQRCDARSELAATGEEREPYLPIPRRSDERKDAVLARRNDRDRQGGRSDIPQPRYHRESEIPIGYTLSK